MLNLFQYSVAQVLVCVACLFQVWCLLLVRVRPLIARCGACFASLLFCVDSELHMSLLRTTSGEACGESRMHRIIMPVQIRNTNGTNHNPGSPDASAQGMKQRIKRKRQTRRPALSRRHIASRSCYMDPFALLVAFILSIEVAPACYTFCNPP